MKKKVKIIGVIIVVIFLVAYGIISAMMPMAVETKTIELEESLVSFIELGVVVNSGERIIYPMTAGEVSKIMVKEGTKVKAGDVLAALDKSAVDLQVIQLEKVVEGIEAQMISAQMNYDNGIDSLKASRSNIVGQLKQLKAQTGSTTSRELEKLLVTQSQSIYERGLEDLEKQKELFELGYISEAAYKDYESLVASYEANYNSNVITASAGNISYTGMRDALNAQIASIDASLERDTLTPLIAYNTATLESAKASVDAMKVRAAYYDIATPIDGVVNEIMIENVNMVTGMTPAFIVQGSGENKIEVKINTRDIDTVHVGDQVKLIQDRRTGDIESQGIVTHISSSASIEISPLGLEERKVQVIIEPLLQESFASGYDVDVEFVVYRALDKVAVPNSALYKKDGKDMAMIIVGGKAKEREIVLGYELTGETIIEEGVSLGEQIIIDLEASGLKVGAKVKSSNE